MSVHWMDTVPTALQEEGKRWGNVYRNSVVCIDQYQHRILVGRLYNPGLSPGLSFQSSIELLIQVQELLNTMHFPQAFTELRTLTSPSQSSPFQLPDPVDPQKGKLATFSIRIFFRQNSSWQGSITWLEGHQELQFRSVLELLLMLDSTLSQISGSRPLP